MAIFGGENRPAAWAALFACLLPPALARTAEGVRANQAAAIRIYLPGAADAALVRTALQGAQRRLAGASCQRLFTEFEDKAGRPLAVVLEELDHTGASYLDLLSFYDGADAPRCQNRQAGIAAFTVQGSRVVYLCSRFTTLQRRYPLEGEATLIHEVLHSLGLGENPPSSRHIQNRVMRLCADPSPGN